MQQYEDLALSCKFCGNHFIWTQGEQEFIQRLIDAGKKNRDGSPIIYAEPKRCIDCRLKKKKMMEARNRNSGMHHE
jgi:hypothetical protein